MKTVSFLLVIMTTLAPLNFGQVRAPNAAGVFAAHEHLITTDLGNSTAFWTALGGEATKIGTMNGVLFPGVYILLQNNRGRGGRGASGGPATQPATVPPPESSIGSVAEAIGIRVRNMRQTL
jgi:hypothetical protein